MINHSWDVFDTLLARRCIHPYGIFHIVEQETKMRGFTKIRIQSEQRVAARKYDTYTIDDIYEEIISSFKVDPSLGARLKEFEINTEIEQTIPIVENLRKVKAGDILISDMYLPKDVITSMLLKVGLNIPFELIVTTNGKASSRIWNDFICQDMQLSHTGDNITTDIAVPGKMGIDVNLTSLARLTPSEDYLLTQNQIEFAQYLRGIRLKNKYSTELEKSYWQLFSSGNLGILLIYLKLIEDFLQSKSYEFVGFCGRDCYFLHQLYAKSRAINKKLPCGEYLYYSRKMLRQSPEVFSEYLRSKINGRKTLLIDITGTGAHLSSIRSSSSSDFDILLCFWRGRSSWSRIYSEIPNKQNNWERITEPISTDNYTENNNGSYYIIDGEQDGIAFNDNIEVVNRAPHNTPVMMKKIQIENKDIFLPVFSSFSDVELFNVLAEGMSEVLTAPLFLPNASKDDLLRFLKDLVKIFLNESRKVVRKSKHAQGAIVFEATKKMWPL
jgi:hypothetical protein